MSDDLLNSVLKFRLGYPGLEIVNEFDALQVYLQSINKSLEHQKAQFRLIEERKLRNEQASLIDVEIEHRCRVIDDVCDNVLPRYFLNSIVILLWGFFESSLKNLAGYAEKESGSDLGLKNIKGKSFIDQNKKYFCHIQKMDINIASEDEEMLGNLGKIRNYIAHCNGRLIYLEKGKISEIKKVISNAKGVSINGQMIFFEFEYLEKSLEIIQKVLQEFLDAFEKKYGDSCRLSLH